MCIFDGSCVKLIEVNTETQTTVFFPHHHHRRSPGTVGGADDVAGQHLLDLRHLLPSNSRVLTLVRLVERRPVSLNRMLQQRSTAEVILSLAEDIAELLEEAVQLLLLERREMLRHGWLMHRSRFGGRAWAIGDSDDLEDADILPWVQAKRLWAVIMNSYP